MTWQNFQIAFHTTTDGRSAGEGYLWLAEVTGDPTGPYAGEILLDLAGHDPSPSLGVVATSRSLDELTVVAAEDSATTLRLVLLRNPFEERLSFGGSARYEKDVYNVTVFTPS